MANVNLKTDFKDGEKLFGQQLNNNFSVIKAALEAVNRIAWQDDPNDSITAFRGTTEEINQRDVIDGQLLYDTSTGETYIDVGSQRISTGSGNAIHIGSDTPTNPATQIWIDPNEPLQLIGTEIVNSMEGNENNKAPSVQAIKNYIDNVYSTDEVKTNKVFMGKPIYRKVYIFSAVAGNASYTLNPAPSNVDLIWFDLSATFLLQGSTGYIRQGIDPSATGPGYDFSARVASKVSVNIYVGNLIADGSTIYATLLYTKADATSGGDN